MNLVGGIAIEQLYPFLQFLGLIPILFAFYGHKEESGSSLQFSFAVLSPFLNKVVGAVAVQKLYGGSTFLVRGPFHDEGGIYRNKEETTRVEMLLKLFPLSIHGFRNTVLRINPATRNIHDGKGLTHGNITTLVLEVKGEFLYVSTTCQAG